MQQDWISLIEISRKYGKRVQSVHKIVNRLQLETLKLKSFETHGQKVSHIRHEDYEKVCDYLESQSVNSADVVSQNSSGVFYLIQLEPEHDPGRFKLGFTMNIRERLRSHRTAAPFARLVKTWPCKLLWEKTAIESITVESKQIHTEVFRSNDLERVCRRADSFFALMPPFLNE